MDEKDREILRKYEELNNEVNKLQFKALKEKPTLEEINLNKELKRQIGELQPERDRIRRGEKRKEDEK